MRRKFMAVVMCVIMVVASTCMITSATVFSAEEKTVTVTDEISESKVETEESSTTVETTVVTLVTTEKATTTDAETTNFEDVGAAIRAGLGIKVRDIVVPASYTMLYDAKGNQYQPTPGSLIWITAIDDVNQRYRVFAPDNKETDFNALYLKYEDASNAMLISHKGMLIGDIDFDGTINAKDMTLMKRGLIYGWESDEKAFYMSDWNADGEVTIKDLKMMQNWLLGVK